MRTSESRMNANRRLISAGILTALVTGTLLPGLYMQQEGGHPGTGPLSSVEFGKLPLSFEPNFGQVDPSVRYIARISHGTLSFTAGAVVMSLAVPQEQSDAWEP